MKYIFLFVLRFFATYIFIFLDRKIKIIPNLSSEKTYKIHILRTGGFGILMIFIFEIILFPKVLIFYELAFLCFSYRLHRRFN
jgi:hypothetical protein